MRHLKAINHLGRKSAHRKAMLANMAASLIMNKRIATTEAKAKALRTYVEPLITRSKDDSTHSRRVVFSYLQNKVAVTELFREVSPKIAERPGGYTRILKTGPRFGDNADMCIIELVDFNENMVSVEDSKAKTSKRRRGSKKKTEAAEVSGIGSIKKEELKAADETVEVAADETPEEVVAEETPEVTAEETVEIVTEEATEVAAAEDVSDVETEVTDITDSIEETDESNAGEEPEEEKEK